MIAIILFSNNYFKSDSLLISGYAQNAITHVYSLTLGSNLLSFNYLTICKACSTLKKSPNLRKSQNHKNFENIEYWNSGSYHICYVKINCRFILK